MEDTFPAPKIFRENAPKFTQDSSLINSQEFSCRLRVSLWSEHHQTQYKNEIMQKQVNRPIRLQADRFLQLRSVKLMELQIMLTQPWNLKKVKQLESLQNSDFSPNFMTTKENTEGQYKYRNNNEPEMYLGYKKILLRHNSCNDNIFIAKAILKAVPKKKKSILIRDSDKQQARKQSLFVNAEQGFWQLYSSCGPAACAPGTIHALRQHSLAARLNFDCLIRNLYRILYTTKS